MIIEEVSITEGKGKGKTHNERGNCNRCGSQAEGDEIRKDYCGFCGLNA